MRSQLLVFLGLASALLPRGASAQQQAAEARAAAEGVEPRFVGDWAYVPVTVVQGPYVTSFASSTTAVGAATLDLEFDFPHTTGARTRNLDYTALLQRFEGQLGLLRRFAIRANLQGEAVVPNDGGAALSVALNGEWSAGGGVVAQLLHTDRARFALTGDYRFRSRRVVSPAGAIEQTADERRLGRLLTEQEIHSASAAGSFALRLADWLGVVAEAGWQSDWQQAVGVFRGQKEHLHFLNLAGAVGANFWQRQVPLGVTAFWRERVPLGDSPFDSSRQFGGGVFYTGRPYLDLGVEIFDQRDVQRAGNFVRDAERLYVAPRIRGYF